MKLEIGKKYKSRSGKVYTVTSYNGHTYGHSGMVGIWYEGGNCLLSLEPHQDDLIEEIKECNMEFLTTSGVRSSDNRPIRVGDAVRFIDHSYCCYTTSSGLKQDGPESGSGVLLATNCKLPFMSGASANVIPNDAIVFINGKTYFTRLAFLKRA
jgi:hypothetical protein